jgi:hypothetical protein
MHKVLIVIAAAAGMAACSSSNGTDAGQDAGPCQTAQTPLDFGDCAAVVDAGTLAAFTITPQQRAACEASCTSSTDLTAVTQAFGCLNAIPVDAGPCSAAHETSWENLVASKGIACEVALSNQASSACYTAVTTPPDAG